MHSTRFAFTFSLITIIFKFCARLFLFRLHEAEVFLLIEAEVLIDQGKNEEEITETEKGTEGTKKEEKETKEKETEEKETEEKETEEKETEEKETEEKETEEKERGIEKEIERGTEKEIKAERGTGIEERRDGK